MKNIRNFLSEYFRFLVVKFSIYLNRRVFVMSSANCMSPDPPAHHLDTIPVCQYILQYSVSL